MRDNTPEQNITRLSHATVGMDEFEIVAYLSTLIEFDNMHPWQIEMIAKLIDSENQMTQAMKDLRLSINASHERF